MARAAKATRTTKPAAKGRKPAAVPNKPAIVPKARVATTPQPSKGELRAQLEKLQTANTKLRAKNRTAGQAAKDMSARIADIEEQVAKLERKLASFAKTSQSAPAAAAPRARRSRKTNAGAAVPPAVAVKEPPPPDTEAEFAGENLEDHPSDERFDP
jgi:hypothetical protein